MDAIMYLKEKARMTKECTICCSECPLNSASNNYYVSCGILEQSCPEEAISIIEKWSEEHPRMTNKEKFIKDHPNAPMGLNGYPQTYPYPIGYCKGKGRCTECDYGCKSDEFCWDLPYEGDENE